MFQRMDDSRSKTSTLLSGTSLRILTVLFFDSDRGVDELVAGLALGGDATP
jgi:hypothetical protein